METALGNAETEQDSIARLRGELRSAEAREAAVRDLMQTMARSQFDLHSLLQAVIDRAVHLCEADVGNIARQDGSVYRIVAFTSFSPEYEQLVRERVYLPGRDSLIGRTVLERQVVHIRDVLDDPEYALTELQHAGRYRTVLGVPMLREGSPIGAIAVGRTDIRPFSDAEIGLLETFADQASVAIENVRLFQTVERQRSELARFAPEVAVLLSNEEGEALLAGHRVEITVLFSDLRGFTAFAETTEPEEVMRVLRDYHATAGDLVSAHSGTIEHFAGDGLVAIFNDPVPIPDHELAAIRTAARMRERFIALADRWRRRGFDLGLGIGIATGYATLGRVGFEGRYEYSAIGTVVNLAARLSDLAAPGEVLLSERVHAAVEDRVLTDNPRQVRLKGFSRPITTRQLITVRNAR